MSSKRRIKAADVAEAAGVSTATVSYVLNNTPGQKITDATAARVRDAAARLGYVSNPAAASLARGDSRLVIIDFSVFPRSEAPDRGIQRLRNHFQEHGYTSVLTWWGPERWEEQLQALAADVAAARVLTAIPVSEETRTALRSAGVKAISSVVASPEELVLPLQSATAKQVQFLAEKGHSSILFVPDPAPELAHLSLLRGYSGAQAAESLGVSWHPVKTSSTPEEYRANLRDALRQFPEATSVAGYNDLTALAAMSALQSLGVTVPGDIAVIGIDNLAFSPLTHPPLTTVEFTYDFAALTADSVRNLLGDGGTPSPSRNIMDAVSVEVVERDST